MEFMPGMLLVVRGARRSWFRREKVLAQVLALEPDAGIIHVSVLWEPPEENMLLVEIGFLPILAKVLETSIVEIAGSSPVGTEWWSTLQDWKSRRAADVAGAFLVPLWEARHLAWDTVRKSRPDASRENIYLESVFPEVSHENRFGKIRVVAAVNKRPAPG